MPPGLNILQPRPFSSKSSKQRSIESRPPTRQFPRESAARSDIAEWQFAHFVAIHRDAPCLLACSKRLQPSGLLISDQRREDHSHFQIIRQSVVCPGREKERSGRGTRPLGEKHLGRIGKICDSVEPVLAEKGAAKVLREIFEQRHRGEQQAALASRNRELAAAPCEGLRERVVPDRHVLCVRFHPPHRPLIAFLKLSRDELLPRWVASGPMELRLERLKLEEVAAENVFLPKSGEPEARMLFQVRGLHVV